MKKYKTVFFGTPEFAVPILKTLAAETRVAMVVVRPDRPRGRGRKVLPPPVKRFALETGIEIVQPEKMREPWFLERLQDIGPDLIVTAAFGRIIPPEILALPPYGCWNLHASLLPRFRGAAPIQRAIWEGEVETGISLMKMDEGLDTGPILLVKRVPIDPADTGGTLMEKLADLGGHVLSEGLARLRAGNLTATPQPTEGTLAPMIRTEETVIDWSQPAERIRNQIRALAPRPGARTTTPSGPLRVLSADVAEAGDGGPRLPDPGRVASVAESGLLISAGCGTLLSIRELQPAGKRSMTAEDFLRGRRVSPGDAWGDA